MYIYIHIYIYIQSPMIISQQGLWTLPTWVPTCLDAFKEHPIILGRPFLSAPMPGLLLSSEDSSERVLQ